jgi:hypothetical protein
VSDLLNPVVTPSKSISTSYLNNTKSRQRCVSTPIHSYYNNNSNRNYQPQIKEEEDQHLVGKPRSRFSEYEDNIIRNGVAQRLTWGQISDLLPHRKRATCFNRYRTLQGIRKSRKQSESPPMTVSSSPSLSPVTSCFHGPTTPPPNNNKLTDIMYPMNDDEYSSCLNKEYYQKQQHYYL